jgi:hypothetical protein
MGKAMTDKELLELAAKAASIECEWKTLCNRNGGSHESMWIQSDYGEWNPLTDDGDALRLAVKLRMCVESWGAGACAVVIVDNRAMVAEPHYGDDPERATRRAITRAAAAIGEQMP